MSSADIYMVGGAAVVVCARTGRTLYTTRAYPPKNAALAVETAVAWCDDADVAVASDPAHRRTNKHE